METAEYHLRPKKQEFAWRSRERVLLMTYSSSCLAVIFSIMVNSMSPDADGWLSAVVFEWIFTGLAIMGWVAFLIGFFTRGIAVRFGKAFPSYVEVSQGMLRVQLPNRAVVSVERDDVEELCLKTNLGDTMMPGTGIGLRMKEGAMVVSESDDVKHRLSRSRRRHGYEIWIESSAIGNRAQVAAFWAWMKSFFEPGQVREMETAKHSRRWTVWAGAVFVTLLLIMMLLFPKS